MSEASDSLEQELPAIDMGTGNRNLSWAKIVRAFNHGARSPALGKQS